jgi:RNA polymerase sigma-70 factor (ECF subfamily)
MPGESLPVARPTFDEVYEAHVDFVWRSVRRLGVSEAAADDLVQETFLVVHRRLLEWEGRSSLKTWIFGIALGLTRNHRRSLRRRDAVFSNEPCENATVAPTRASDHGPHAELVKVEAMHILYTLLEHLDEDKRAVFVLAELEQMTMPEIADALDVNPNTAYTRLRAARAEFEQALVRYRAGERRAP